MSVTDYEARFSELSRHALQILPTEAERVRRFVAGLHSSIQASMAREFEMGTSYYLVVEISQRIEGYRQRGDSVVVDRIYRSCVVTFCGYETRADLLLLDMIDFEGRHMVEKGCLSYLAYVRDTIVESPVINSVPVVREFSDVFPSDLPSMPPDHDIYFCIDLAPGTQPISILSYCMAPKELMEQLEEL
ncbi:uncharacterized protein [Nicotiana tomentosiformis]|uniref:uncharacterized protein n=1 Tax=Nicotiana tomentosiformis TaxID=4098 RepID=UPI00388C5529